MFSISGENLTNRLRKDAFGAMLRQEMGWYDKVENNTGALCARLSASAEVKSFPRNSSLLINGGLA